MLKLRARSRSFSSNGNANKEKEREHYPSGAKSKDDINLKPSGNNNNSIGEFPQELARSLQALALSLSTPSSAKVRVESGEAPSRPLPPIPLKPILRSSTSAVPTEDKGRIATGTTPGHRNNSSVSSTGSSKQISFILPENPTRSGSATAPEIRHAAASAVEGRQSRRSSASSRRASSSPSHSRVSSASTTAQIERAQLIQQKSVREFPVSLVLPPRANAKDEAEILHIKSRDTMQVNRAVQPKEGRRCSLESLSKELPPLPLNASAPPSSTSLSSRNSSRQSGHTRGESASSAASSVLSNPVHLPRLKLGELSLGFPANLLTPTPDSPASARGEDRIAYSPLDDKRFAWMGLGRKRDSSESKRSSKRRSDSSVVASSHSLPMNKHQRSRSSQLHVVHEVDPADITLQPGSSGADALRKTIRPTIERNFSSGSKDEAARMTELWVSLLEDFVLLCDDPSMPPSQRTSASSLGSSFVAPPSPSQTSCDLLEPKVDASKARCPTSPSPSSECDPFLRLPPSARRKYAAASKPLPPSPMPSLEVDDSAASTTTYTQSPSTPAESESPSIPSRPSFNPFEASFSGVEGSAHPANQVASTSHARGASLPATLTSSSNTYGASRPGKQRPPPLQLSSTTASNDSIHTAVPPQTEAQTHFYTSQRSRSLPTSSLEPGSYRQPISPSKKGLEGEQLSASTSSTGSNRASRRYHFPSSYGAPLVGIENLNLSTNSTSSSSRRRNKSIDEGYSGTGLTPTPTSDTFSIPPRSRETSVSSTSDALINSRSKPMSSINKADGSLPMLPSSSSVEGKRTPENSILSKSHNSEVRISNESTPVAKRYMESTRATRSKRSQSASEHIRKRSSEAVPMKRSPTLEIVMYGVAL